MTKGGREWCQWLRVEGRPPRLVGTGICGATGGELISGLALAIGMGAGGTDIGRTIHPPPTLGESVGMAAEYFEGVCTDLAPRRKR